METMDIASMTEYEAKEYRNRCEITIDCRDIPKPVKSFGDVGFMGIINIYSIHHIAFLYNIDSKSD